MRPAIDQLITFLYTDRLEETARFYEEELGLELALDQGTCRIYAVTGGAYLGFCSRETAATPDGVIVTLVSPDVDAWYDHLKSAGVTVEKPPQLNSKYQIYHCFARDPNGYLIEIQRFEDPRWQP